LKPSFVGGFRGTQEWISLAEKHQIGWWITSALESNIGLNAIAQWTYLQQNLMPQGLGTGALYTNNFDSPLTVAGSIVV
jgi:O-succinylbenzoate synthase